MSNTWGTRAHTGAPARKLERGELMARRAQLSALPPGEERTRGLAKIRAQLASLNNRSERRGV